MKGAKADKWSNPKDTITYTRELACVSTPACDVQNTRHERRFDSSCTHAFICFCV